MKKRILATLLAFLAAAVFAQGKFAWVDSLSDDKDGILPGVDPAKVTGFIIAAGS